MSQRDPTPYPVPSPTSPSPTASPISSPTREPARVRFKRYLHMLEIENSDHLLTEADLRSIIAYHLSQLGDRRSRGKKRDNSTMWVNFSTPGPVPPGFVPYLHTPLRTYSGRYVSSGSVAPFPECHSRGLVIVCEGRIVVCRTEGTSNWGFPKGQMEEGEKEIDTALRETREEVGLIVSRENVYMDTAFELRRVFRRPPQHPRPTLYVVRLFLCRVDSLNESALRAQPGEIAEVRVMEINEALTLFRQTSSYQLPVLEGVAGVLSNNGFSSSNKFSPSNKFSLSNSFT